MSSRADMRFITTKEGYEEIKNYAKSNDEYSIIEKLEIKKEVGDIIYLGWNSENYDFVETVEDISRELDERDISYRLTIIREYLEEGIEQIYYTSDKDEDKNIPFPSVIKTFDEKDMEKYLGYYSEDFEKNKENEMEMGNSE